MLVLFSSVHFWLGHVTSGYFRSGQVGSSLFLFGQDSSG